MLDGYVPSKNFNQHGHLSSLISLPYMSKSVLKSQAHIFLLNRWHLVRTAYSEGPDQASNEAGV